MINNSIRVSKVLAFFVSLLMLSCAKEDSLRDPDDIFIKYYGTRESEWLADMVSFEDGILMLGSTQNTEDKTRDLLVIMTDFAGNRLWQYQYAMDTLDGDDEPGSIGIVEENGIRRGILIGTSDFNTDQESIFISEFDLSSGEPVSDQPFFRFQYNDDRNTGVDAEFNGPKRTRGTDVMRSGNNYIILGSVFTGLKGATEFSDSYNIFLSNIPLDGSIPYDTASTSTFEENWDEIDGFDGGDDFGYQLAKNDNGEFFYLASSEIEDEGRRTRVLVARFNEVSGVENAESRLYGTSSKNEIPESIITHANNVIVTGSSFLNNISEPFYLRLNSNLNEEQPIITWPDVFLQVTGDNEDGISAEGSVGTDIARVPGKGSFFICGRVNAINDEKQNEVFLMEVDTEGTILNDVKIFGSEGNDQGNAIEIANNGSIFIGSTIDFGFDDQVISLIKTNSEGLLE